MMLRKTLVLCSALAFVIPACGPHYTTLSPAQLTERGTHRYANATREKATEACAVALATLGYKVTVKQPESGVVKTAPSSIMTSATGGAGYADVTEDGLAWSIAIDSAGSDVVVHATPRGFRNGSEVRDDGMWVAEVMDAKFGDLWREMGATLGR
jgi:hypothetical protein